MIIIKTLVAIGMLAIAGTVGAALGYLQSKWEEGDDGELHKR